MSSGQAEEEMSVSPEPVGPSGRDEEEEEMPVCPEPAESVLTRSAARAPAEAFESVLARRAAQALAKQMGAPEPPSSPLWFRDYVYAFYRSSEAFMSKLRDLHKTMDSEEEEARKDKRQHCRQCKREGYTKSTGT